ncbi:cytochrome P450 [Shimazuella alba]|nr:cytochrome P450 [Shimazuella alba]
MCIGWNCATQEMKVILAILLQWFRFVINPDSKITLL